MYTIVLAAHILGALCTGFFGAFVLTTLVRNQTHLFSLSAKTLAGLAVFQTLSGALLALLSPEVTALSLCDNLALYFAPIVLLEVVLMTRMNRLSQSPPIARILYPMLGSVSAFCALVFLGV
jgi:hypothetical protein